MKTAINAILWINGISFLSVLNFPWTAILVLFKVDNLDNTIFFLLLSTIAILLIQKIYLCL